MAQSEINIAIGNKEPQVYFGQLLEQCQSGLKRYGNITDPDALGANLRVHCIPAGVEQMTVQDYRTFLTERRKLIAQKIRTFSRPCEMVTLKPYPKYKGAVLPWL
jgi:hypothetical protein